MAQMKEQINTTQIEQSDEERVNLPHAEFKTLVMRMLTEMVQYGLKIEEKVKVMQCEIKKSISLCLKEYFKGKKEYIFFIS